MHRNKTGFSQLLHVDEYDTGICKTSEMTPGYCKVLQGEEMNCIDRIRKQVRHCTYNVKLGLVRATTVVVEKQ